MALKRNLSSKDTKTSTDKMNNKFISDYLNLLKEPEIKAQGIKLKRPIQNEPVDLQVDPGATASYISERKVALLRLPTEDLVEAKKIQCAVGSPVQLGKKSQQHSPFQEFQELRTKRHFTLSLGTWNQCYWERHF